MSQEGDRSVSVGEMIMMLTDREVDELFAELIVGAAVKLSRETRFKTGRPGVHI